MFKWMHKRKMSKLISSAEQYVVENYQEAPIRFNPASMQKSMMDRAFEVYERLKKQQKSSENDAIEPDESSQIKYSARYSLSDNYDDEKIGSAIRASASVQSFFVAQRALDEYADMSFVDKMQEYIRTKKLHDTDVYKAAIIDRRLYSKISSDRTYKPSKDTCVALALALQLSVDQAKDLLTRAGYALSHSNKRDLAIEYCFADCIYDVNDVNELLYQLDLKTLGR